MEVIIIAAVAKNGVIGKKNSLPWHLPEEFKHFKKCTTGFPIIMGRRTFESIGKKPLPNRLNIVLSRHLPAGEGYRVAASIDEALALCTGFPKAFIIGGARVYQEALKEGIVDTMILSELHKAYDGDTFFPPWDRASWHLITEEEHEGFTIRTYTKR